jgi:hypothetical protein
MIVSRLVDPLPMRFFKVQKEMIYFALSARPVPRLSPGASAFFRRVAVMYLRLDKRLKPETKQITVKKTENLKPDEDHEN